jgi:hypothetical protein
VSAATGQRVGFSAGQVQKTAGRRYKRSSDTRYLNAQQVDRAATDALRRLGEPCKPHFNKWGRS